MERIRMLTKGPNNNHKVGEVREVDSARADALIEGDHAELAAGEPLGLAIVKEKPSKAKAKTKAKK